MRPGSTNRLHGAIPEHAGKVDGWRFVPLKECGEPLVAIGPGTKYDDLMTTAVYAGEHLHSPYRDNNVINAAHPTIYVRYSVADKLLKAQSMLRDGLKLIIFDGYRSTAVQQALYDQFMHQLRDLKPDWTKDELQEETERYVSRPSSDPAQPSPHSTGGAIDVAIVRDGRMIEFGTPFDHGSVRSALRYFERDEHTTTDADVQARDNRRMLYHVMYEAGFEAFEHEWWHYNARETQMGAYAAGIKNAQYGNAVNMIPQTPSLHRDKVNAPHPEPSAPIDRIAPTNN